MTRVGARAGTIDDRDEDGLLGLCPRCAYALRGLPVEHRCPECGLTLDRRWEVFGGPLARRRWKKLQQGILLFLLFDVAIAVGLVGYFAFRIAPLFLAGLIVMLLAPYAVILRLMRVARFVVVGPDSVGVFDGREMHTHPVREIKSVQFHPIRKLVVLTTHARTYSLGAGNYFGMNIMEAEACARAIQEAQRRSAA